MAGELMPMDTLQIVPSGEWIAERDRLISCLSTYNEIVDDADYRAVGALDAAAK